MRRSASWLAVALACAGCLSSPPSGSGPDGGPAGIQDPGKRFRTIGPRDQPIASIQVELTTDRRVLTSADAGAVVRGMELVVGDETTHVLEVDGDSIYLEDPLSAGGSAALWNAFDSLTAWKEARARDLTAAGVSEVALLIADEVLDQTFTLDSFVTDADHRVVLSTPLALAHRGHEQAGVTISSGDRNICLSIRISHVDVEYLDFAGCGNGSGEAAIRADGAVDVVVDGVLVHDYGDAGTDASGVASRAASEVTVRNSILVDGNHGFDVDSTSTLVIASCTIYRMDGYAVEMSADSTVELRNSIAMATDGVDGTLTVNDTVMSDGSVPDAIVENPEEVFVDSASVLAPDLHLDPNASAIDSGLDLSGQFTRDVDGETRSGAWDIGADEWSP
jgi:hypothetical protein